MKTAYGMLALFLLAAQMGMVPVFADPAPVASLATLVEEGARWDGHSLVVRGELIGEPLRGSDGIWLNLLEAGNPLAVFCPQHLASPALNLTGGAFLRRGCLIEVVGVLHRICQDHGADHDFHVSGLRVIAPPEVLTDSPRPAEVALLMILSLAVLLAVVWKKCSVIADEKRVAKGGSYVPDQNPDH